MVEVQSHAIWEARRVEGIGRGLAVGGVAALAFGALSPVLAVDPAPLPSP